MKKNLIALLVFIGMSQTQIHAQEDTLIWIGDEGITANEYIAVYNKNKDVGRDIDPKTPQEYMDLFINFKLKVKEAKTLGRDTLPGFKREFGGYRSQLAKPYLVDKSVDEVLYKEAYERMKNDVRASHIMLDCATDALPEDTLRVYNEIMAIRKSILNGDSFEEKAKTLSTDTYSAKKGGDLGYFTVFSMVYPFETMAYTTPVGEVSMPVRTQFGYHILKVTDKRPAYGKVEVKHIFLISNNKTEEQKAAEAEQKIGEIYSKIEEGTDFDLLARQYSDDKNTSQRGGLLPAFGINKMMPEFEEASFALNAEGEVTAPFKSEIGWHIVKLVKKLPIGSYEDELPTVKENVKAERASRGKSSLIAKLKKEYNFKENSKRLKDYLKVVDDSYLEGTWDAARANKLNKTIFELNDVEFNQKGFTKYFAAQQTITKKSKTVEQEIYKHYQQWVDLEIIKYEDSQLENKYPEFKLLVNEYRDGILLFDLTEEMVWNKASKDSAGLHQYYMEHTRDYWWGERAEAAIVSCANKTIAKKVIKLFYKGNTGKEILTELNTDSQLNVIIQNGIYSRGENPMIDQYEWKKGETDFIEVDERVKFVYFAAILQPEPKKLEEARGLVISDYQKQLEKEWIQELRVKYPVKINDALFEQISTQFD